MKGGHIFTEDGRFTATYIEICGMEIYIIEISITKLFQFLSGLSFFGF